MAYMMSSHMPVDCRGSDSVHQHRQFNRQSAQDNSVEVNRPSVEGISIIFNRCYYASRPTG